MAGSVVVNVPKGREKCPMCDGHGHVPVASTDDVRVVWQAYAEHHPRAVRRPDRMRLIRLRLQLYPAERLVAAVHGNHMDQHCNEHDYHDLNLILRLDKIERYEAIYRERGASPRAAVGNGPGGNRVDKRRVLPPELGGVS